MKKISARTMHVASLLLKQASAAGDVAHGVLSAGKGFLSSGKHISEVMARHGVQSHTAHTLAKAAPYVATAVAGKKTWESEPVMRARYRIALWKQQRAMNRGGY